MRAEFFLAGMKAPLEKGGGRILLGDNTRGGIVMLRSVRFRVYWSLDFSWTALYIHTHLTMLMRSSFPLYLPERAYCLSQALSICIYIYIYIYHCMIGLY